MNRLNVPAASRRASVSREPEPMDGALSGILGTSGGWEGNVLNHAAFPACRESQQKVPVILSGADARRHSC